MSRQVPDLTSRIALALSDAEIDACYSVMRELRPQFASAEAFREQVRRQQQSREGWLLAFLEADGEVRSCAGYRFGENLHHGRYMYVDDLVTRAVDHGQGYGQALFTWLESEARRQGCRALTLDSGVQRFDAHRFYLQRRMRIASHHFVLELA